MFIAFFTLTITTFFTACATTEPQISFKPPAYVEELPPKEEEDNFGNPGSIFGRGDNLLFSDRRAMQLNDLVTVIINQTAQATSTANKNLNETSNATLTGPGITFGGPSQTIGNITNQLNNITGFGISTGQNTSTFQGAGSQNRQEAFTTTIAARIIKVLQNGNYFIEGSREVLINGEKQVIHLSGVVRPNDIARDNTIESRFIADAKIMYDTQGELKRNTEKGWGTKLLESVWPF
ncbi:flagellar basal body L-ring protein [Helicobacter winghamensis]|uniref:Flagellar L-ring protein n=1 Tax=Helicobacter winghamensis TaxID=157268 RepID=A0A2N3PI90_9HELI|nr:flagellar L-ring protein FlgH [Helicobacter winghamensis ATCC BAA-430]PKT75804.1 flagellar basal body L-ring protein [Helicobacter winghamensis]PKT76013.1 flagellar basal body L-ring protein [Helicobacter winghamensis]PKT76250.1 flagellar basal body L-ring protein [Helicobacter winghamensis]PKT80396.1 flagellar basal body L-ring protein [Helicobacter winghamensis]